MSLGTGKRRFTGIKGMKRIGVFNRCSRKRYKSGKPSHF